MRKSTGSMEETNTQGKSEKKKNYDNCEIRTHACEHNALAGRRLNHSAKLSSDAPRLFVL